LYRFNHGLLIIGENREINFRYVRLVQTVGLSYRQGIVRRSTERLRVRLSTYADNVALPAFAHSNRSISPARQANSSKPAGAGLLPLRICCCGPMLGQADLRTPSSFIGCAPHTMCSIPITNQPACRSFNCRLICQSCKR